MTSVQRSALACVPDSANAGQVCDRYGFEAAAIYLAIALLFFGRALAGHFTDAWIGGGNDPSIIMWSMVWWPHALVHGANPFLSDRIWAPAGYNVAWSTAIPLPSLIMSPLTASAGPIAGYNLLALLALPLDGWAAFLLCRYLCGRWWPSLLGGYIYGFSAFMLGQLSAGHVFLTLGFLAPLAGLVVARAIAERMSAARLTVVLAAILTAQFLISTEVFATITFFGAIALFLGWSSAPRDVARRILAAAAAIALAYVAAAVVLSPYLYYMLHDPLAGRPLWSPEVYSSDLSNLVVPTAANALGGIAAITGIAARFCRYSVSEMGAYLGLPLLLVAAVYAGREWRRPLGKTLVDSLVVAVALSLGPRIHMAGKALYDGPGKILVILPILDKALPARLMNYAFLFAAVIVSLWLAKDRRRGVNLACAVAVVIFTLPNLNANYWVHRDDSPVFFRTSLYRNYLAPNENVLVLPFSIRGNSMLWQAETGMYFRMTGGWTPARPPEFRPWPIIDAFLDQIYVPDPRAQLKAFLARHRTSAVVVVGDDRDAKSWDPLVMPLSARKAEAGGVTVYRIRDSVLASSAPSGSTMERAAASALFDALVLAGDKWLATGTRIDRMTPIAVQRAGLMPVSWLVGPTLATGGTLSERNFLIDSSGRYFWGAWLGRMPDGRLGVGLRASYDAVEPILARFGPSAVHVYYPYPRDLLTSQTNVPFHDERMLMVVEFEREKLATAAAQIRSAGPTAELRSARPADGAKSAARAGKRENSRQSLRRPGSSAAGTDHQDAKARSSEKRFTSLR